MLYVRHMAWLSATPEKEEVSRAESFERSSSPFLKLPDVGSSYYVVKYWQDCGSVGYGSSGIVPLSWTEIRNWREENDLEIDYRERKMIREMSKAYVSEFYAAKDPYRPAPYSIEVVELDRPAVSSKIANVLSGFKRNTQTDNSYTVE